MARHDEKTSAGRAKMLVSQYKHNLQITARKGHHTYEDFLFHDGCEWNYWLNGSWNTDIAQNFVFSADWDSYNQ